MYPSTHQQPGLGVGVGVGGGNLTRYGSAPGSLLSTLVDSVIGTTAEDELSGAVGSDALMGRYFSGDSSSLTSESSCKATVSPHHHQQQLKEEPRRNEPQVSSGLAETGAGTLERSYGFNQMGSIAGGGDFVTPGNFRAGTGTGIGIGSSPLIRHSSSPAGFFNHLSVDNDFAVKRGLGPYSLQRGSDGRGITNARLKSQLSFTRQDSLPQISEVSENIADGSSSDDGQHNVGGHSYASAGTFPMGSWDNSRTIMFSTPPSKRAKDINGDIAAALSSMDSDSQFSLPSTSLEMSTFEKLLQMQQDSVPCKIRAKRGCATHPRSIAERERRSRISRKMRKLQELVPNMDKQTSNADMLDLAIQYIKNLQNEVQKLNKDMESCSCGSKKAL